MAETFYSVLGVDDDADAAAVRRAYREQVKEHHPDVSDDPAASERFKRLTTAKEVLVDADERARYDRLGHDAYVRQHVESTAWTVDRPRQSGSRSTASDSEGKAGTDRTAWTGETATAGPRHRRQSAGRGQRQGRAAATGARTEEWQHASKAYRRADVSTGPSRRSRVWAVLSGLKSVGPWLLVHLVFVGSAAATAWLTFAQLETYVDAALPTLLLSVSIVALVVFASALHVVSQLYA